MKLKPNPMLSFITEPEANGGTPPANTPQSGPNETAGGTPPDGGTDDESGTDETIDGEAALGDPGKKALDTMKAKWKSERDNSTQARQRIADLERQLAVAKGDDEATIKAREDAAAAEAKINQRLVRAEARVAAKGRVVDVDTALALIDLSTISVDANGDVDADAVTEAIDALLTAKPFLAAQGGNRFGGDIGQGSRKGEPTKAQVTQSQLDAMSPAQINQARKEGRLNGLLGIK